MNTHHQSVPADARGPASSRWVCRIIRHWSAISGGENSRHLSSCAACREFFATSATLDNALRRDARRAADAVSSTSEGFEREILRAVRNSTRVQTRTRWLAWGGNWAMGGLATVAAVVVAALVFERQTISAGRANPESLTTTSTAEAAVIVQAVESLSNRLVDSVIPSAGELVARNPLQQELGSVYSDMRSALDFLALNFLPTAAAPSAAQSGGRI
jgi:hypothetical protein